MITEMTLAAILTVAPFTVASELPASQMQFRECVAERESGGSYRAKNPNSTAMGRWQWLDSQWRRGLSHMVAVRLKDHGMPWASAKKLRDELRRKPISEWHPRVQDVAFAATLNADRPWSGWRHWRYGDKCDALVPGGVR